MGVLKKKRRKIVRRGRLFYWCVKPDYDYYDLFHLSIVSSDKQFIVSYQLNQGNLTGPIVHENSFIVVIGKEFKGLDNLGGCWKRFLVPKWEDAVVTPYLVAKIIDWCFTAENTVEVDCRGHIY